MATKRKRGNGKWEFKISRATLLPKPYYFTFADEQEGDDYCRRIENLLDRGIVPQELREQSDSGHDDRLRTHVTRYLSEQHVSDSDRRCLKVATERLPADLRLREVTFPWAQAWITRMKREENLSPSTIKHHVGAMTRCFDWLAAKAVIAGNPLRLLPRSYARYTADDAAAVREDGGQPKENAERDRRLNSGEEESIRKILGGEKPKGRQRALELREQAALALLFDLALETAMRLREMFTLTRDQVNIKKRTIFLEKTKNGTKRQVPLSSVATELLREHLRTLQGDRVFPWWDGDSRTLEKTTSRLSVQFGRIFGAAGCGDLHFHDLRHEATSRLYERTTLSDNQIAKIVGHMSRRMQLRYANLRGEDLAQKLW